MTPAARIAAAAEILDDIRNGAAANQALAAWGRANRFAGSGDRHALRDLVFTALRRKRSAAARGGGESGRALMIGLLREAGTDPDSVYDGQGHGPTPITAEERARFGEPGQGGEALDLPDWLLPHFEAALGQDLAVTALALRERAPVFLRANLMRASRAEAIAALRDAEIEGEAHDLCETAIRVIRGERRIAQSRPFLDGLVELQDVASQAAVSALPLCDGMRVLDFCCGGGGKTLAMAGLARAEFTCHDISPQRMTHLPERARRAGITPRLIAPEELDSLPPQELVLCDAPCSGSGSWRRDPEGKWALSPERLEELTRIQDRILDQAIGLVAPGGTLAYATCSLLRAENEDRVAAFHIRHPGWVETTLRRFRLSEGGDGFFLALLTRGDSAR
ncbi:MAG: RsmB/NOP family class I SAM-dependent RNA methyltransferase [Pseudooceanicola sp.]